MPRLGSGARGMRDIARDCARAGAPGRGIRRKFTRNVRAAALPILSEVQANARAIPDSGRNPHAWVLGEMLARATWLPVTPMAKRTAVVRLIVDGKRMPPGYQSLPPYMEGNDGHRPMHWRHPIFALERPWPYWIKGNQPSHPFVQPAVVHHLAAVDRAVMAAVDQTAAQLKGLTG